MSEQKIPIPAMLYNAAVGGHVTNSQQIIDENLNREQNDINQETVGAVPYNSSNPNGMGRIVLKKNDNFKEVVETQTNGNTIFVIKYDFTLTDNVTIPDNCVLDFKGGSILGSYTITGNDTVIFSDTKDCLKNVLFAGTFKGEIKVSWLGLQNTYNSRNIVILHSLSLACQNIIWDTDDVYVSWQSDCSIKIHTGINDFRDTKFHAKNETDDYDACLFVYAGELLDFENQPSTVAECIASSVFTGQFGCLVINDQTPMTTRVQGSSTNNIYRSDIIGVSGNAALNEPILPYDSDSDTVLSAKYFIVDYSNITIKNLIVIREWSSTQRFNVLSVNNAYNVIFENAFIQVDESRVTVTLDVATSFNNVYNLRVANYTMDGSFSYGGQYAYGLNLYNVYNLMIDNVQDGDNGWEMIAGNCMNKVVCKNSNLKLLDCHFYSKDFLFQNCTFRWHGAQCASHFGYIKFDSCKFNSSQCHYIDSSYGVRTDYDIIIENCVFDNVSRISSCAPAHRATRSIYGDVHKQPNITVNGLVIKNSSLAFYGGAGNGSLTELEIVTFNHVRKDNDSSINITDAGYNNLQRLDVDDYEEKIKSIYQTSSNFINTDRITGTTINITNSKLAIGQWNSVNYSTRRNLISIKNSTVWGLGSEPYNAYLMLIKDCVVLLPKIENTNSYVVPYNTVEPYITFESCYFKTIDGGTFAQGSSGSADSYKAYTRFCVFFDDYSNFRKAGLYDWYRMTLTNTPYTPPV